MGGGEEEEGANAYIAQYALSKLVSRSQTLTYACTAVRERLALRQHSQTTCSRHVAKYILMEQRARSKGTCHPVS